MYYVCTGGGGIVCLCVCMSVCVCVFMGNWKYLAEIRNAVGAKKKPLMCQLKTPRSAPPFVLLSCSIYLSIYLLISIYI